jgi:anti-sigma factor RsiW
MDGALTDAQAAAIAHHLQSCDPCKAEVQAIKTLGDQIRAAHITVHAPDSLRRRIDDALARHPDTRTKPFIGITRNARSWIPTAIAAGLALWLAGVSLLPLSDLDHDLAGAHLAGLASSTGPVETPGDQLNPLLALGGAVAPVPKDFAERGFKLLGARNAQFAGRPGSALIYQTVAEKTSGRPSQAHMISLFITRAQDPAEHKPVHHSAKGLSVIRWTDDGRDYAAVSDLDRSELDRFVKIACDEL